MKKTTKKMVKTGYGLGLIGIAKAKKVAALAKKELKLNDKESLKLAREVITKSAENSKGMLKMAEKRITTALLKSKLVKKRDLLKVKKVVKKGIKNLNSKKGKKILKKVRKRIK